MHPPLHEMPESVEHHEVERYPHQGKGDAKEAGGQSVGAQVAIA